MSKIVVTVSGGFDPVHIGHVRLLKAAKNLGSKLVVILNGDSWLRRKKGKAFMPAEERKEIIKEFYCVDYVYIYNSDKDDVVGALKRLKPDVFANGGDRKAGNIPEYEFCRENNIQMMFNVGGKKIRSSSKLLKNYGK